MAALLILVAGLVLLLTLPVGRRLLFGARVMKAAVDPTVPPATLTALFEEALKRALAPAGVDTSLVRREVSVGTEWRYRLEVPLSKQLPIKSGVAAFDSVLARFHGHRADTPEPTAVRGLVAGTLRPDVAVEVLFLAPAEPRSDHPRLALLVDQLAYSDRVAWESILSTARGLTVAIHPWETGARDLANDCRNKGVEVVVDLPMEDHNYPRNDPGRGAILVDLSEREIRKNMKEAWDQLGGADGFHTFGGGLAVEDRVVMAIVLDEVRRRHAYFLDSTGSRFSTVERLAAAREVDVRSLRGDLDAPRSPAADVRERLEALAAAAREKGVATGVIHPWPGTVAALRELLPKWAASGIELVPMSEVVAVPPPSRTPGR